MPPPPPTEPPPGPEAMFALPVLLLPELSLPIPVPFMVTEPFLSIVQLPLNVPLVPVLPLFFMTPMLPLEPTDVPLPVLVPPLV